MSGQGFPARRTALGGVLLALFCSGPLFAQEDESEAAQADSPRDGPPSAPSEAAPFGAGGMLETSASDPARDAAVSAIGVERLPASAFPAPQVRGLEGGSLSRNLHGLQWPYLPVLPGEPATRIGLSGSAWVDSSYRKVDGGVAADPDLKEWQQQSRLVLRVTPTYGAPGGWFVQAQGEFFLVGSTPSTEQENLGADDLYVRAGKWGVFDVTAGRFQGWEIYHLGMGLDENTVERRGASTTNNVALDISRNLQFLWDRPDGPGNIALHFYPLEFLRFELLARVGGSSRNELGLRPAGILDFGVVKAKVAGDYVKETPREQSADRKDSSIRRGTVGSVQLVLEPLLEAGASAGYALIDDYNAQGILNAAGSNTTYSMGGFANVRVMHRLVLGGGGTYTNQHNLKVDATGRLNDTQTHTQFFGAVQYALWDQLYVKGVFAYATALFDPQSDIPPINTFRNESISGRVRLLYLF